MPGVFFPISNLQFSDCDINVMKMLPMHWGECWERQGRRMARFRGAREVRENTARSVPPRWPPRSSPLSATSWIRTAYFLLGPGWNVSDHVFNQLRCHGLTYEYTDSSILFIHLHSLNCYQTEVTFVLNGKKTSRFLLNWWKITTTSIIYCFWYNLLFTQNEEALVEFFW